MAAQLFQLNPHENMTPAECLEFCSRNADDYQDVIVVGLDPEGRVILRSSHIARELATFVLLEAVDKARGKS